MHLFFTYFSGTGQGPYMEATVLLKQNEIQMIFLWAKIGLTNDRRIPKDQDD